MVISPSDVGTTVFSKPDVASDTIASVSGYEFTIYPNRESFKGVLVGGDKYEDHGLPLLSITRDSAWARVCVQSSHGTLKKEGWIDLVNPKMVIHLWADFWVTRTLVLRDQERPRFYSRPKIDSPLNITLFRFRSFNEYSYLLKPIRREGRWLLVELQTPFLPCGNDEAIEEAAGLRPKTIRVWIQYLDKRGRPLVRAPMMC